MHRVAWSCFRSERVAWARRTRGLGSLASRCARMLRLWLAHAWLCAGMLCACHLNARPDDSGGIVLVVGMDLAPGKDIDRLSIDVVQNDASMFHADMPLEPTSGTLHEFRVPPSKSNAPARIHLVALKDDKPRVERSAITSIPKSYLGVLRLPIQYLCDGLVQADGHSTCEGDNTCKQGRCEPSLVEAELQDYSRQSKVAPRVVDGDAGAGLACFDVSQCFSGATEAHPDPETCAFPAGALFNEHLNVALRFEPDHAGMCDDHACWVVLDAGSEGFRVTTDNLVMLPPAVCDILKDEGHVRVAITQVCDPKSSTLPLCGAAQLPVMNNAGVSGSDGTSDDALQATIAQSCIGLSLNSCGRCGTKRRDCQDGLWSSFSSCSGEGECGFDQKEFCGHRGTRSCRGDCSWGPCEGQGCDGVATRACGRCGTQRRGCDNGTWGEWDACEREGSCTPGATQRCGNGGTQSCGGDCEWGACGDQHCDGTPSEPCGTHCGSRTRTCDNAVWSEWSECIDMGDCTPDETRSCGSSGVQTCGGDCHWDGACAGQTCEGTGTRSCGYCGTQTRTCDTNAGAWSDWSACTGEGDCTPDSTRGCGVEGSGTQVCGGNCQWASTCFGQKCEGETLRACGKCGTQSRVCDTARGQWMAWSACSDEGECNARDERPCGSGGVQACGADCRWGSACTGQMCPGAASRGCDRCGKQTRSCDMAAAKWSDWSACNDQGACAAGEFAQRGCGAFGGQTCSAECEWGACGCVTGYTRCTGSGCVRLTDDAAHCGACGTACAAGQGCESGKCKCSDGGTLCAGACVDTLSSAQHCGMCGATCAAGRMCRAGKCACLPGQTDCGGTCVDTQSATNHCGMCGVTCGAGRTCSLGKCVCPAGQTDCGGVCVDTQSSASNCGVCGATCSAGTTCQAGHCACSRGLTQCDGQCVDLQTSRDNCGLCGGLCATGRMCRGGDCVCPRDDCAGSCVDLRSAADHCGVCETACAGGKTCQDSQCRCPAGQTDCAGTCANTQTDAAHCGASCQACLGGRECQLGQCVCPAGAVPCNVECCGVGTTCNDGVCIPNGGLPF